MRITRAALALLIAAATLGSGAARPSRNRHVVIVSLDGFAAAALANPDNALPNLRRLIREGASASAMRPVNPTVTWPNHTSIVTGVGPAEHGVLYNGAPVRHGDGNAVTIEPHVPKDQLVHGTTLYDAAHAAGLTTAEVDWVAIEGASTITWSFGEWPKPAGALSAEMLAAGRISKDELARFDKAPITFDDELWVRAGEYLLEKKRPNVLLVHLLTTDSVQHAHGPDDVAANAALALADANVGRLVAAARRGGALATTTFFIVSDHGFAGFDRSIRPNAALAQRGLGKTGWSVSEGGTAMVFVTASADKAGAATALRDTLKDVEGIERILEPRDFAAHGYPQPADHPGMADLVLVAKPGYAFSNSAEAAADNGATKSMAGSHGYLRDDPRMQAIFIAWGAGVKPGGHLDTIDNIDVAPTAARLLGVELPRARGRVLTDILR